MTTQHKQALVNGIIVRAPRLPSDVEMLVSAERFLVSPVKSAGNRARVDHIAALIAEALEG